MTEQMYDVSVTYRGKAQVDAKVLNEMLIPHENGWVVGYAVPGGIAVKFNLEEEKIENILYDNTPYNANVVIVPVQENSICRRLEIDDTDGNPIYEKDYIKGMAGLNEYDRTKRFEFEGYVEFKTDNHVYGYYLDNGRDSIELSEMATRISLDHIAGRVVGNIIDNPELVKEVPY